MTRPDYTRLVYSSNVRESIDKHISIERIVREDYGKMKDESCSSMSLFSSQHIQPVSLHESVSPLINVQKQKRWFPFLAPLPVHFISTPSTPFGYTTTDPMLMIEKREREKSNCQSSAMSI